MKIQTFVIAAIAASSLFAADTVAEKTEKAKKAPKLSHEEFQKMVFESNGGAVRKPGAQKGCVYYVNAQKKAPADWLRQNAQIFAKSLKVEIKVADGEFALPSPRVMGEASLFVIDDDKLPVILHAPESRWCVVNVAPLSAGAGEKPQFFEARVRKELTRGFALLAGAQSSNYPHSLLGCIAKTEALDEFADCKLPVDVIARFQPYLAGYGITPYVVKSYKKACQEGWAPTPTNDLQKTIWDKVHELPTKPIKIEYDEKRDKGK